MANSTSARKLNWMSSVFCRSETILFAVRTQVRALRPTGVREHQRSCGHPQLRLGSAPLHRGTKGKQKNCPTTPYLIGVACLYAYLRGLPPQHPLQTPVTEQLPRVAISHSCACTAASICFFCRRRSMPRWLYPALSLAARHHSRNSCYFNFFRVARHQNLRAEDRA